MEYNNEIWRNIKNEDYCMVSNKGRVKTNDRTVIYKDGRQRFFKGKILTTHINPNGYYQVVIKSNGKSKTRYIHRLVAEAFVLNPEDKPYVNHIDGNKLNNHADNLEWCTPQDNSIHSYKVLKQNKPTSPGHSYPVIAVNTLLNITKRYNSVSECKRSLNISKSHIFRLIKNKRQTKDGWSFKLVDVEDIEKIAM